MDRTRAREVLREIEARYAGAPGSTPEKASQLIAAKLVASRASERDAVTVYQIADAPLVELFFALCDRYEVTSHPASKRSSVSYHVVAPRSFVTQVFNPLWEETCIAVLQRLIDETREVIGDAFGMRSEGPSVIVTRRVKK